MRATPKYVITDHLFPNVDIERDAIQRAGGELAVFQCKTEENVIEAANDADAMLVQFAPITRKVIHSLSRCKVIVRYGIGMDNIDLDAARASGIEVCNIPDYCIEEVADHTFALGLAVARQLFGIDQSVRNNLWSVVPPRPMQAFRQMTFATIGFGRIGRAVLDRARACKFSLLTCDPYIGDNATTPDDVHIVGIDEALATADILSLHVPLTSSTRHLINAGALGKMKTSSILLNTSRGGLVDNVALAAALASGEIAGAGLDVFEVEPLESNHPLRRCDNVVVTSHVAWYSELSASLLQRRAIEEAVRALGGNTE